MSIQQNKAALFGDSGKGGAGGSSSTAAPSISTAPASRTAGSTAAYTSQTGGSTTGSFAAGISPVVRAQRIAEAKGFEEKAQKYLKTSFLQWNPDYLAAAPMFEKAADSYKLGGDYYNAIQMMLRSIECHEGYGSTSSSAVAYTKAAQIAKNNMKDNRKSAEYLKEAGDCWGINGDLSKYGETYAKAAKEVSLYITKVLNSIGCIKYIWLCLSQSISS